MDKKFYCKDCDAFKNGNYCEVYDTNTFPDTVACSKYKAKEIEAPDNQSSTASKHVPDDVGSAIEVPINNSKGIFNGPFLPKGRIRRLEFGISCLIYFLASFCLDFAIESGTSDFLQGIFLRVISFALWIWYLFQSIKRCHDLGDSGWYVLIPLFNPFALLFLKGDEGINEYGSDPKQDYNQQIENDIAYCGDANLQPTDIHAFDSDSNCFKEDIVRSQDTSESEEIDSDGSIMEDDTEVKKRTSKMPFLICGAVILTLLTAILGPKACDKKRDNPDITSIYNDSSFLSDSSSIAKEASNQLVDESTLKDGERTDGIIIFTPPKDLKVEKEKDDSTNSYIYHLSSSNDDVYVLGDYAIRFTKDDFEQVCNAWEDNSLKGVKGVKRMVTKDIDSADDYGYHVFQRQVKYQGAATAYWDIVLIYNPEANKAALINEYRIGGESHINKIVNSIRI